MFESSKISPTPNVEFKDANIDHIGLEPVPIPVLVIMKLPLTKVFPVAVPVHGVPETEYVGPINVTLLPEENTAPGVKSAD